MCTMENKNPVIKSHWNISNAIFAQNQNVISFLLHQCAECFVPKSVYSIFHRYNTYRPCNSTFVWDEKRTAKNHIFICCFPLGGWVTHKHTHAQTQRGFAVSYSKCVQQFWPQSHGDYVPILACCQPWISMNRFLSLSLSCSYTRTHSFLSCGIWIFISYSTFLDRIILLVPTAVVAAADAIYLFTCADCSSFCDLQVRGKQSEATHEHT